ncbi:MAG: CBS domain-containing protein [archaeon]|nr:MAG: CBS domain-containing protein [archaeon]
MKARQVMRKKVITVKPEDRVVKVLGIFSKEKISGAPVMDGKKLVGMITDSDIIAKLDIHTPRIHFASSPDFLLIMAGIKGKGTSLREEMKVLKNFRVQDFMTKRVFTVLPEDPLTEIAGIMHGKGVNRVPVLNGKGHLVGIVARQDIIRALTRC